MRNKANFFSPFSFNNRTKEVNFFFVFCCCYPPKLITDYDPSLCVCVLLCYYYLSEYWGRQWVELLLRSSHSSFPPFFSSTCVAAELLLHGVQFSSSSLHEKSSKRNWRPFWRSFFETGEEEEEEFQLRRWITREWARGWGRYIINPLFHNQSADSLSHLQNSHALLGTPFAICYSSPFFLSLLFLCTLFSFTAHSSSSSSSLPSFRPFSHDFGETLYHPIPCPARPGPARSPLSLSPVPSSEGYTKLCDYMRLLPFVSFSSCSQWQKLWPENVHLHMATHTHSSIYSIAAAAAAVCILL